MPKATTISIGKELEKVTFLENRTPDMTDDEMADAFSKISDYRDGTVFVGHYAGNSEWEQHPNGDEIVMVVEGETTLILFAEKEEKANILKEGDLLIVPKDVWHRFETPRGVKILAVTPTPTIHSIERPES